MTTETIDDILRQMRNFAIKYGEQVEKVPADWLNSYADRIAKARAAELEGFRSVLYGAMEETDYRPVGTWREKRDELLDLIDKAQS